MDRILRDTLILLLLPLQLMAPLSHAHFGMEFAESGIHLPGLEFYHHQDETSFNSIDVNPEHPGVLVCVSNGIKVKQIELAPSQTVILSNTSQITQNATTTQRLSAETTVPPPQRIIRAASPRAPPLYF